MPSQQPRVVGVLLVDPRGWVLLQERDEHAPVAPEQWGIVAGHVEPGEDWVAARDRELAEETGVSLDDSVLQLWYAGQDWSVERQEPVDWRIWAGQVDLTDADIVVGEGRQIVFVDPAARHGLEISEATRRFLPEFLASSLYAELTGGSPRPGRGA